MSSFSARSTETMLTTSASSSTLARAQAPWATQTRGWAPARASRARRASRVVVARAQMSTFRVAGEGACELGGIDARATCDANGARGTIATGQPFLDHMIDQLTAHAQLGVSVRVTRDGAACAECADAGTPHGADVFEASGRALGKAMKAMLSAGAGAGTKARARFASPLDEAYATCDVELYGGQGLDTFSLAPYGRTGTAGRSHIGTYPTAHTEVFWRALAEESGVSLRLVKERGDNAHHIVESTFKAFARGLRAAMDTVDGIDVYDSTTKSDEVRHSAIKRSTKETSIDVKLDLDADGANASISTGIVALDGLFSAIQREANIGLDIAASGDLWIDDHHTAEDVSIAVGQALNKALGTKKGCNRMGSATSTEGAATVECVMDLSNRPYLGYGLELDCDKVGDLSVEMVEHMFMSLTFNGQMTVHLVEHSRGSDEAEVAMAAAKAFGKCLRQCAAIDPRRAGAVASSKGTLSV
jgi:imidazoleglycerol-phosphate dehydratase